jgi:hypothetical protein
MRLIFQVYEFAEAVKSRANLIQWSILRGAQRTNGISLEWRSRFSTALGQMTARSPRAYQCTKAEAT